MGCRPREPLQSSGLKSAFTAREGRLYRGLMQSTYGASWKDQLHDQTVAASMEAEEAADLAEEARSRERRTQSAARLAAASSAATGAAPEAPARASEPGSEVTALGGTVSSSELRAGTLSDDGHGGILRAAR